MPKADLFRRLGLFARERVFDAAECREFREGIRTARRAAATVRQAHGGYTLDESVRRVRWLEMPEAATGQVRARLTALRSAVEQHFGLTLIDCQRPQFLAYSVGDYYRPHQDLSADDDAPPASRERRISAVIFLNAPTAAPTGDSYGGGALTFYGLLDDPRGRQVGLPLDAEEGLLVAFRSETVHGVAPVIHGERYTVVSWYR
jgi:SM-20-related protein